jgi:hypothetical protein
MFVLLLKNLEPNSAQGLGHHHLPEGRGFIGEAIYSGLALPRSLAPRDPLAIPNSSGALARGEAPVARGAWTDASMSSVTAPKAPQLSVGDICHVWSDDGAK